MRTLAGYFFWGKHCFVRYAKPPLSIDDQIALLRRRGLIIADAALAGHWLRHTNYYRLRGYWLPFEEDVPAGGEHQFRKDTLFEDVVSLYVFDRHVRLLVLDLIERIEVSIRTQWAHHLGMRHGAHAHLRASLFRSPDQHAKCLASLQKEIDRSRETFIEHYLAKYSDPPVPPVWAACEVMSLGLLSKWTKALNARADRQAIATTYGLDETVLCSFLHHLSNVRNICAHHGRLWNRHFTFTMKIPRSPAGLHVLFNLAAERQVFNTLTLLGHMMDTISPGTTWRKQLLQLLANHPQAQPAKMGFPAGWEQRSEWAA